MAEEKTKKKSHSDKKKSETKKHAEHKKSEAHHSKSSSVHHEKQHHTKKKANSEGDFWKTIAIVLIVLLGLVLIGIGGYFLMNSNSTSASTNNNVAPTNSSDNSNLNTSNPITLYVVEDPKCTSCGVDEFAAQIKAKLIPNLVVKKIDYTSDLGKTIINVTKADFVPIYLFSKNIDQRSDFSKNLASAFIKVTVNGVDYYELNPQYVPSKIMLKSPKIIPGAIVYGNKDAPVTIYEFSDYECPFCAIAEGNAELDQQFSQRVPGYVAPMPEVNKDYIETGKVKLVFYNMPLESLHPNVRPAHLASLCVYNLTNPETWYKYHELLYHNRSDWINLPNVTNKVIEMAGTLGVNETALRTCMENPETNKLVQNTLDYGTKMGVTGTPAFFINRYFISGAQDFSTFKKIIDGLLANQ